MVDPLTPEALVYDSTPASDPQLAPDGSRVLYTLSRARAEAKRVDSEVWLVGRDGEHRRRLSPAGQRASGARWSPQGDRIAYTSTAVVNERTESTLYVMSPDAPGGPAELTRYSQPISFLAWSPDGSRIAFTAAVDPTNPTHEPVESGAPPPVRVTSRIDYKQDNRGYLGDTREQIFIIEVATGACRQVTTAFQDHEFPAWSPDGAWLLARVPNRNGLYSRLALVAADTGATEFLTAPDGVVGVWSWSPSGDRIFFAGDTAQTWQYDYFVYAVASSTTRRLTTDLAVLPAAGSPTLVPPSQPVWLDGRQVLVHAVRAGRSGLYAVDAENGANEPVHEWQALHVGLSTDRSGRFVAQGRASLETLGEIVIHDTQHNETRVLAAPNAELLQARSPAAWEQFQVERGAYTIDAWLLRPPGFDERKRYPVILDIHGGPNGHYGYGFNVNQQCLATNGFLVLFTNPRGSSSYGRDFTLQVREDWGGEDYLDLMAALDATLQRPYADSSRVGIYGYSYGGYMTSWTIARSDRFQAAVCGAPCFDLESFYGTSDIGHVFGPLQFGGAPHERRDWYERHSPSTYAHQTVTPTLIVHGEADHRCPIGQGEQMFTILKENGCEVEFVRYPGASHLFMSAGAPAHRVDVLTRTLRWFKDHLGEALDG